MVDTPGRQRHQRAARRHHLRLHPARRRGDLPARRGADPDRLRAPVPGGAHPALDPRPAGVRGRQGRPAGRGRAGGGAAFARQHLARHRARAGDVRGVGQAGAGGRRAGVRAGRVARAPGRRRWAPSAGGCCSTRAGRRRAGWRRSCARAWRCGGARWSCRWPSWRSGSAARRSGCASGKKALETAAETIRAETAALKARVRQDLAAFTDELRDALAGGSTRSAAPTCSATWRPSSRTPGSAGWRPKAR